MGYVRIRVEIVDANGQNADLTLTEPLKLGGFIPVSVGKAAAEAAGLALMALDMPDQPLRLDRGR